MRILHLLDHSIPLQSGYTFRTLSILEQQRARGWETFHLTSPKHTAPYVAEEEIEGWRFFRTPPGSGIATCLPVLREIALMKAVETRLYEIVEQVQPDIIHAHSPVLNAIPALRAGRRRSIPVVYEVRAFWEDAGADHGTHQEGGPRYRAIRSMETRALKKAQAVTTICDGLRTDMVARGIAEEKITVIPNAVNIDAFQGPQRPDPALQAKLGLAGKEVIGFIGSLYAYEGMALLLDAMTDINARRPDCRLLIVGGGPESDRLQEQCQTNGLESLVTFTGRVPHEEVSKFYDLIDVLVYPRLPMRLTELVTPLKPLEAMAMEKIVVASDVGGHRELIRDGETGHLFAAGNKSALAETIDRTFKQRDQWPQQVKAGRYFVEQERNWKNSVARYQSVYDAARARMPS